MGKKPFLEKYFRPWSLRWLIQRFFLVIKERRFPQISIHNLLVDYRFTKEVKKQLKAFEKSGGKGTAVIGKNHLLKLQGTFELDHMITCEALPEAALSPLNRYFDHIYIVNLERRTDRRLEMIQKLSRLNIRAEFFKAEDGYSEQNVREFNDYMNTPIDPARAHEMEIRLRRKVIYSPGAWGTLKTYKRLLLDAKARKFSRVLCLEDDAVFAIGFDSLFEEKISQIPQNWKVLYLGASQHAWEEGIDLERLSGNENPLPYYLPLHTDGAFAIGLHKDTFDYLLGEIDKMNCSFDSGALRSSTKQFRGDCYVMDPNLIIADVRESDIRISRKQLDFAHTVRWNLDLYEFPFKQDLVSVIMPAFNAEKTIEMSLRSVMNQSYRELEIIVVDDGSTDRTAEIVSRLAKEDDRIRLISSPQNAGCYPARNLGLRNCTGKFITFHDADDISLKDRLQRQLIYHCLGDATFSVMRNIRSRLEPDAAMKGDQESLILEVLKQKAQQQSVLSEYRDIPNIGLMTTMFNRELFEELGLYWENRFGSDAEFIERVLFRKAGILGGRDYKKVVGYLSSTESIPGLFRRIDTVGIISPEMTDQNLTRMYPASEREAFEKKWRERLQEKEDYLYPTFE